MPNGGAPCDSLFGKPLRLPEDTLVYPAHDYEGRSSNSVAEERRFNPRLQVGSREEYIDRMNTLSLDPPRMIEVAVPANRGCGLKVAVSYAAAWACHTDVAVDGGV